MPASPKPTRVLAPKPWKPKGITARLRAGKRRRQATADRLVYAAVDRRDGQRCRVCHAFAGDAIQRHHIVYRSLGGATTSQNVVSLCAADHADVHGGRLKIRGDADAAIQIQAATRALDGAPTSWATWEDVA